MHISVIRPEELGPGDLTAWHDMQRSTPTLQNPFLSPEFTMAVGRFRADARVAVLTEGAKVSGFLPFEKHALGVGMPIGAGLTDCQGLVHTPGFECDPRELLRGCGLSVFQFDHLMAEQRVFQRYALAKAPSPVIDLTGGFSAYRARLELKSAQFCRDTARKGRKLCREVGPLRLVADSRDQVAFRSLLAWKSSQYRRTGRTDRFAKSWIVGLVNDLFHIRESDFSGLFSVLYAGEVAVAAHFGVRSGPVLGHWFPAYDTRFGRYSPGSIQHLRMVEEMAAMGVRLIDMGKGAKRYKETLKTSDLYVCEGAVTGRSPLAMAHRAHVASGQWAVRTIRSNPRLFRSADYLLRRYGQLRSSIPNGPRERD